MHINESFSFYKTEYSAIETMANMNFQNKSRNKNNPLLIGSKNNFTIKGDLIRFWMLRLIWKCPRIYAFKYLGSELAFSYPVVL